MLDSIHTNKAEGPTLMSSVNREGHFPYLMDCLAVTVNSPATLELMSEGSYIKKNKEVTSWVPPTRATLNKGETLNKNK